MPNTSVAELQTRSLQHEVSNTERSGVKNTFRNAFRASPRSSCVPHATTVPPCLPPSDPCLSTSRKRVSHRGYVNNHHRVPLVHQPSQHTPSAPVCPQSANPVVGSSRMYSVLPVRAAPNSVRQFLYADSPRPTVRWTTAPT